MDKQEDDSFKWRIAIPHDSSKTGDMRIFQGDKQVWPAHPVNVAESSSPMPGLSPKQGLEDCLTRLDQALTRIEESQKRQESILLKIIEALAEDQDPDEMPATYMDGTPV